MCPHGWDLREQFCVDCADADQLRAELRRLRQAIRDADEETRAFAMELIEKGGTDPHAAQNLFASKMVLRVADRILPDPGDE